MAANLSGDDEPITGINVTPFVDVMLVLLVIFMVTATTIVKSSLDVSLPEMQANEVQNKQESVEISLSAQGLVQWDSSSVALDSVAVFLDQSPDKIPKGRVSISADKSISHGEVIKLIDILKQKGIKEISLNVIVQ